jgi:MFS transporter, NNP family, nitrate/nitrite transporter
VTSTAPSATTLQTGQSKNLVLALLGFTITFWAWNIIAPLGVRYSGELGLSPMQTSFLFAMPVLVGSLGRVPVGALTDRYGGRMMFTVLTMASAVPVLLVAFAEHCSPTHCCWSSAFSSGLRAPRSLLASRS